MRLPLIAGILLAVSCKPVQIGNDSPASYPGLAESSACQCDQPSSSIKSVDVRDFLAYGDSDHDDTAAIQAAATFALAHGRSLYLPAGGYRITAPIVLTGSTVGGEGNRYGFRIHGDAPSRQYSIWHAPYTGHSTLFVTGSPASWPAGRGIFEFSGLNGVNLENLWFLGNGIGGRNSSDATTSGVRFVDTSQGHTITSCCFQLHGIGLDLSANNGASGSCGYSSIRDSIFTNCHTVGMFMIGGDTQISDCFFSECRPENSSATDFVGVGLGLVGNNYIINGGKFEWNSKGILLYNAGAIAITGMITDRNTYALSSAGSGTTQHANKGIVVSGCRFMASAVTHVHITATGVEKSTGVISGCSFAKGDESAYDEGNIFGGAISPVGDFLTFSGDGKHVWSICGNSMECSSVANTAHLGGHGSRFTWSGNSGYPVTSSDATVTKDIGQ